MGNDTERATDYARQQSMDATRKSKGQATARTIQLNVSDGISQIA